MTLFEIQNHFVAQKPDKTSRKLSVLVSYELQGKKNNRPIEPNYKFRADISDVEESTKGEPKLEACIHE